MILVKQYFPYSMVQIYVFLTVVDVYHAANDAMADLGRAYPVSAKYMAQLHRLPLSLRCRITERTIGDGDRQTLRQLGADAERLIRRFSANAVMETA